VTDTINRKPANFDWVAERSKCSVREMFEQLKLGIKQDVEAINKTIQGNQQRDSRSTFKTAESLKTIKVFFDNPFNQGWSVVFTLAGNVIRVSDGETNQPLFNVGIGLNVEGDCRFKLGEKECDSWEVRRKALEELFFREAE
jgi:hypothetical protein